jgi:hypothetical protein
MVKPLSANICAVRISQVTEYFIYIDLHIHRVYVQINN